MKSLLLFLLLVCLFYVSATPEYQTYLGKAMQGAAVTPTARVVGAFLMAVVVWVVAGMLMGEQDNFAYGTLNDYNVARDHADYRAAQLRYALHKAPGFSGRETAKFDTPPLTQAQRLKNC